MAEQTYALAKSGVFGLQNGVYQDTLATIIDDLEDGDISEYGGSTGSYSANTNAPVANGSYSLKGTTPSGGGGVIIRSDSGLNAYPSQGDTFRYNFQFNQTDQLQAFLFGAQSTGSGTGEAYRVEPRIEKGNFSLYLNDGTSNTLAQDTSVSYSTGVMYEVGIDWASDGTITTTLYDDTGSQISQISATDTTYTSGGVGWRSYDPADQSTIVHDYARIL